MMKVCGKKISGKFYFSFSVVKSVEEIGVGKILEFYFRLRLLLFLLKLGLKLGPQVFAL